MQFTTSPQMQRRPEGVNELSKLLEFAESLADDFPELSGEGSATSSDLKFAPLEAKSGGKEQSQLSTDEQKLEKVRERERRKYRRKKEKLGDLKHQVATLELQLQQLTSQHGSSSAITPTEILQATARPTSLQDLKARLIELKRAQSQLRGENTALRRQFREASQRVVLLSDLLKTDHRLYYAYSSHFRLLNPLTHYTCCDIRSIALQKIHEFKMKLHAASVTGTIAGWKGRRFVDRGVFKFTLDKTIHRTSLEPLNARLWSHLVDPSSVETVYSAEMNMSARLVQKVDDDNYVFLEEMLSTDPSDNGATVKTAILMARFKTDTGYLFLLQNLNKEHIGMKERSTGESVILHRELWISSEQLVWVEVDDAGNNAVSIKFRGIIPTIGASTYFWMSEIMLVSLRSEMKVIGSKFSIPTPG